MQVDVLEIQGCKLFSLKMDSQHFLTGTLMYKTRNNVDCDIVQIYCLIFVLFC